ncbi:hypothetical protein TNCV_4340161 [Trichonephila clavipes]|nr:hypothetical protein TNCV_4340161 [Trichonephila clavipes]
MLSSLANKYTLEGMTFTQDGAPPHIATHGKHLLRTSFGEEPPLSSCLASPVPSPMATVPLRSTRHVPRVQKCGRQKTRKN